MSESTSDEEQRERSRSRGRSLSLLQQGARLTSTLTAPVEIPEDNTVIDLTDVGVHCDDTCNSHSLNANLKDAKGVIDLSDDGTSNNITYPVALKCRAPLVDITNLDDQDIKVQSQHSQGRHLVHSSPCLEPHVIDRWCVPQAHRNESTGAPVDMSLPTVLVLADLIPETSQTVEENSNGAPCSMSMPGIIDFVNRVMGHKLPLDIFRIFVQKASLTPYNGPKLLKSTIAPPPSSAFLQMALSFGMQIHSICMQHGLL